MRLRAALRRGLRSILARPGRATLAAFGIGLGVAAVLQLLGADADPRRHEPPARIPRLMVSNGERESLAALRSPAPDEARRIGLRAGEGRLLSELDQRDLRRVAVLGAGLRAELFGFGSGLRETIWIGGTRFTVVGILEPAVALPADAGPDWDRSLWLPGSTVAAQLAHLTPGADAPSGGSGDERPAAPPRLLGAVALVSLLLGGCVLATAMLATVLERRQESALRLVVGATRRMLFAELLLESVLVATLGGLGGAAFALSRGFAGSGRLEWDPALSCAPLALGLAVLVGAAAGLFPALRAAATDPARALGPDAMGAGC